MWQNPFGFGALFTENHAAPARTRTHLGPNRNFPVRTARSVKWVLQATTGWGTGGSGGAVRRARIAFDITGTRPLHYRPPTPARLRLWRTTTCQLPSPPLPSLPPPQPGPPADCVVVSPLAGAMECQQHQSQSVLLLRQSEGEGDLEPVACTAGLGGRPHLRRMSPHASACRRRQFETIGTAVICKLSAALSSTAAASASAGIDGTAERTGSALGFCWRNAGLGSGAQRRSIMLLALMQRHCRLRTRSSNSPFCEP